MPCGVTRPHWFNLSDPQKSLTHVENELSDISGLVQERRNSSALAMELRLSCTNPWICHYPDWWYFVSDDKAYHNPFHIFNVYHPPAFWNLDKMADIYYAALVIMPSHQQNRHVFTDGRKNMNDIFNNHICNASHMSPGLHFQNV